MEVPCEPSAGSSENYNIVFIIIILKVRERGACTRPSHGADSSFWQAGHIHT